MLRRSHALFGIHAAVRSLITRDQLFFDCRFRSRTPGPPPFSSMNSTPAERGQPRPLAPRANKNAMCQLS